MNSEIQAVEKAQNNKRLEVTSSSIHTITMDDLRNSIDETFDGSKPIHGIRHFQMIDEASEVLDKHNMTWELDDIYAANNKSRTMPGISIIGSRDVYKDKEYNIENILFRRILTRLIIKDMADERTNSAVGLNFHQSGVEIAFGANVHICQNMCLMGGDLIQSYGPNKTPLKDMFDTLSGWIKDFESKRLYYQNTLSKMMDIPFSQRDMAELAGWLVMYSVKRNSKALKNESIPPLNAGQINRVVEEYLKKHQENPEEVSTLYDVYNLATELYKPGRTAMNEIYQANHNFGSFLSETLLK